ncbi:MAG: hypothetical protein HY899_02525 [Deltaproteobacteria bacterium]|nr:hypothetical protein [Deltaproteobacteria bacterium]
MKTTLDLPDALMRAVKIRAAQNNRRLKDVLAEVISRGLLAPAAPRQPRVLPEPVRLESGPLTIDDIETAIANGRD